MDEWMTRVSVRDELGQITQVRLNVDKTFSTKEIDDTPKKERKKEKEQKENKDSVLV